MSIGVPRGERHYWGGGRSLRHAKSKGPAEGSGSSNPGPGSYNYSLRQVASGTKRFVFGKAARNIGMLKSSALPGPGYYNYDSFPFASKGKGKGYSFGRSARSRSLKQDDHLGPGAYTLKDSTFKKTHGFIGKARRSLNTKLQATPGYHDVPVTVPNLSMYHYAPNRKNK